LARPGVIRPPTPAPTPNFFFSPTQAREHDTVQFDASTSKAEGTIVSYSWSFGDGATGSGVRPTHVYNIAGTYNVALTITDDAGASASTAPTPITIVGGAGPAAVFTVSPT